MNAAERTTTAAAVDLAAELRALLRTRGVQTSADLQIGTGRSQAAVSRALATLAPEVVAIGRARATRYAIPREILGWSGVQPIVSSDATGRSDVWGELYYQDGNRLHVASHDGRVGFDSSGELPWFLEPLRPQGFLGRLRGQSLGFLDANPERWTLEQVLFALIAHEHDHPGALAIASINAGRSGTTSTTAPAATLPEAPVEPAARAAHYERIAQDVNQTLPAGSSAGGEQPKFIAHVDAPSGYEHLIVKFSPPRGTPFGERWSDLLHTEKIALDVLRAAGIGAAEARIVSGEHRTFLESLRFDRIGRSGKRHVVPLSAVHRAFVSGAPQHWVATAEALVRQQKLPRADADQVALLREFGRLIGNTDMHFGNLSLWVEDLQRLQSPRFRLAPVYDMLSMIWRPGEFRDQVGYAPIELPGPSPGAHEAWREAATLAAGFWQSLSECDAVSEALREVAVTQCARLLQHPAFNAATK